MKGGFRDGWGEEGRLKLVRRGHGSAREER